MQVKKQQLGLDTEQQTDSKLGKEYIKAVYCHPAYLTCMKSTSWEMLGRMKHNLDYTTLIAESEAELKSLLMKVNEESEKAGLKLSIQNLRSWYLIPSLHGK